MLENVIKKLFPIRDEKGQPCTFPTFGSQVFGEDGDNRALWQAGKGFYADHAKDTERLDGKDSVYFYKKFSNPRNLLDNSDFRNPVNQRGQTSYTTNGYTIDRWQIYNGGLYIGNGYIAVKEAFQLLELDMTKTYTLAAQNGDGIVTVTSNFNTAKSATIGNLTIAMSNLNGYAEVILTAASGYDVGGVVWVALYEGEYTADNLPPYIYKGYAAELAECQRYLRIIGAGGVNSNMHAGYAQAATTTVLNACITIGDMRLISPSYKVVGDCVIRKGTADTTVSITDMSVHHGIAYIQLSAANLTAGDMYALRFTNGGHLIISADL